jgi:phosphoribosylanthranilate isomerase
VVRVKICGITNVRDARAAVKLGADALGFNFYKASPRYIEPARAKAVIAALPPFVCAVGLFVNDELARVNETVRFCELDAVQLHGDEPPRYVERVRGAKRIKGLRVRSEADVALCRRYRADAYLLDAYVKGHAGGTGRTFDWALALPAREFGPVILAGGLTPENVEEAVEVVRPYGVDTASGVERAPGEKDRDLMEAFIRLAKGVVY